MSDQEMDGLFGDGNWTILFVGYSVDAPSSKDAARWIPIEPGKPLAMSWRVTGGADVHYTIAERDWPPRPVSFENFAAFALAEMGLNEIEHDPNRYWAAILWNNVDYYG